MSKKKTLMNIHRQMKSCRACPQMCGEPVHGPAFESPVLLIGQAPGANESDRGKPFAHTAGKTLFKWLNEATSMDEEQIREFIYIAAVARCFPGKAAQGSGDREPNPQEIKNCRPFLQAEVEALEPQIILPVGRLAIGEVLGAQIFPKTKTLAEVVGKKFKTEFHGQTVTVIPLPHPSGVSRWTQTEPGKTKLRQALSLLKKEIKDYLPL